MKPRETVLNTPLNEVLTVEEIGDDHQFSSFDTPINQDKINTPKDQKKAIIAKHFKAIMETLGLDLTDDSLSGTPERVAKMYVDEIFKGLLRENKPKIALFDNKYAYNEMLIEKDITLYSNCEHHFLPIVGKAHIAYISSGKVIGLSKLNRIAQYYAKRPQVQERLTVQIAKELEQVLETDNVAIIIDADHMCVSSRGVKDVNSSTITSYYGGKFQNPKTKDELLTLLKLR
jgi:GTP cyclohydrolase I